MVSQEEIYLTAAAFIALYGNEAEPLAIQRMHELMEEDDAQGASIWLSIAGAIDDLQSVKRQGKLH